MLQATVFLWGTPRPPRPPSPAGLGDRTRQAGHRRVGDPAWKPLPGGLLVIHPGQSDSVSWSILTMRYESTDWQVSSESPQVNQS